jgi:DNA-binding NarL/FixJ family response regulator
MHPPSPAVVVCGLESDPDILEAVRQAGALGYVFKTRIAKDLTMAVKSVASGQSFVSPS